MQELFGPVASFYVVETEDEAIQVANATPFGLGGSVFTGDLDHGRRVAERVESGMVFVNHPTWTAPNLPFGGVKNSGYGRELSELGFGEFVNRRLVSVFPRWGHLLLGVNPRGANGVVAVAKVKAEQGQRVSYGTRCPPLPKLPTDSYQEADLSLPTRISKDVEENDLFYTGNMRCFAYADESGNSGLRLFGDKQDTFWTGTLIGFSDLDTKYGTFHQELLVLSGKEELHGNELGFGRIEKIAGRLAAFIREKEAPLFFCSCVQAFGFSLQPTFPLWVRPPLAGCAAKSQVPPLAFCPFTACSAQLP